MEKNSRIFVAGHRGLVGSAIVRNLKGRGYNNLVLKTRSEVDLCNQSAVHTFFKNEPIDYVFLSAAKVGGIHANNIFPADFLYENLMIECNIIRAAAEANVKKLLFLGSSCIYPKDCPQPIKEEYLLTGKLEPTNEAYAIAKIAGLMLCEKYYLQYSKKFISAMPTNLYGIYDNFHPEYSHVLPALLRRFHEAKVNNKSEVTIWGSGKPKREFLFSDDLAEGLVFLMENYDNPKTINIGTGEDLTILQLAEEIKNVVGYQGKTVFDTSRPDGTPRKLLDVSRIQELGWKAKTPLRSGIAKAYAWATESGVL